MEKSAMHADLKQLRNIAEAWLIATLLLLNKIVRLLATCPKQYLLLILSSIYEGKVRT